MEDVSTHESLMTDFVNSLKNTKKSQVLSGDRFDQITEYLNNPEQKIDPNFSSFNFPHSTYTVQLIWWILNEAP